MNDRTPRSSGTSSSERSGERPDQHRFLARVLNVQAHLPYPVTSRPMFGGTMVYADGRPVASLSAAGLAVKLTSADRSELIDDHGGVPLRYGPDQPQSHQYVVLPPAVVNDDDALTDWLTRAGNHVASLRRSR